MIKKELLKDTMAAAIIALGVMLTASGCSKVNNASLNVTTYVEENPSVTDILGESEEVITSHYETYGEDESLESEQDSMEEYIKNTLETSSEEVTETSGEGVVETSGEGKVDKQTETETTAKQTETETTSSSQTTTEAPKQTESEESSGEGMLDKETETETTTQAPKHEHTYTSKVTKEPTCTSEGVRTYSCSCGNSYTEVISAKGHSYGSYTYNNDATENADGTETATCSVCGAKDTRTASGTKLVHNHSYSAAVTKEPTCTEEGTRTYTCGCGNSYTESIPATGHSYGEYVYNDDATTSADGTKTATCSVCGAKDTITAEGTKKELPSWYDEHPGVELNVATGGFDDGSLEMYFTSGGAWTRAADGCWDFGYSATQVVVGNYAEGQVAHGYLYK